MRNNQHEFREHESVKEVLSQFTTQKDELLYKKFQDNSFRKNHPEAIWFFDAYDYANTDYLMPVQKERVLAPKDYAWARSRMTIYLERQFSAATMGLGIDFLIALSGELQEQRSVENLSICLLPSEKSFNRHRSEEMITFGAEDKKPLCHNNVHGVRKQLDLAKSGGLAVCKNSANDGFYTVGILDNCASCAYPRIILKKNLEWEFHIPCKPETPSCRLRYKQGTIMMPLLNMSKEQEGEICRKLQRMNCNNAKAAASTIAAVFPTIERCDHGAIMIFFDERFAAAEALRLASSGRGFLLSPKRSLFYRGEPNETLIKRMASIDGAILADFNGNCHAYGVILDGKAIAAGAGSKDRGARYNSTKTYIDAILNDRSLFKKVFGCKPVRIGIVRSEDGMVDLFP